VEFLHHRSDRRTLHKRHDQRTEKEPAVPDRPHACASLAELEGGAAERDPEQHQRNGQVEGRLSGSTGRKRCIAIAGGDPDTISILTSGPMIRPAFLAWAGAGS
jgi:hypothetical protein